MLPASAHVLLNIALRTGVIYLLVLIGVRLSGKREVGQMTPFDLVLLLLLSNSVQNAMTGPDTSLVGGMVAATVLLVLNYFVADLSGANRRFRKFIQGQPSMLIHDGEVIEAHMAKEHVSMDDLERALRAHGISDYHQVAIGCSRWMARSASCATTTSIPPRTPTWFAAKAFRKNNNARRKAATLGGAPGKCVEFRKSHPNLAKNAR